jgi:IS30 family transposase
MSYSHLSIIERSKLEILHRQGKSSRAIAKELGRHSSTIYRELDRANSSYPYQAEHAQNAYEKRRQSSVSSGKWSDTLAASLEEKLKATWSPEQINQRFRTEGLPAVSFKTIYRWIYAGRLVQGTLQVLRHKGKRQKPAETRGKFSIGRSISDRPQEVRSRETFGNWIPSYRVGGKVKDA